MFFFFTKIQSIFTKVNVLVGWECNDQNVEENVLEVTLTYRILQRSCLMIPHTPLQRLSDKNIILVNPQLWG